MFMKSLRFSSQSIRGAVFELFCLLGEGWTFRIPHANSFFTYPLILFGNNFKINSRFSLLHIRNDNGTHKADIYPSNNSVQWTSTRSFI